VVTWDRTSFTVRRNEGKKMQLLGESIQFLGNEIRVREITLLETRISPNKYSHSDIRITKSAKKNHL
jgi:hypothetical protein